MAVPHRRPVTILREAAAVVLIRPYKTILQPGVFLRVAVAVHAAIPAAVAVAVPLVHPVADTGVGGITRAIRIPTVVLREQAVIEILLPLLRFAGRVQA